MLHLYAEFKKVSRENTQRFTANHSNKIYVMMAVVIVTFLFGKFILGTILALPIFLSAILGIVFSEPSKGSKYTAEHQLQPDNRLEHAA